MPFLVGWVSGIQDLFAMLFVLLAMKMRVQGRHALALGMSACALLSKETSVLFLPVLAWFPWIAGSARRSVLRDLIPYSALALLWAGIHPGIRGLLEGRFANHPDIYVGGVRLVGGAVNFLRYFLTLLNIPQPDAPVTLLVGRNLLLALIPAMGLTVVALRLTYGLSKAQPESYRWPPMRLLLMGLYMATAPLVLTSATVRGWQPYYVAFGGIGLAVLAAQAFSSRHLRPVTAILVAFLSLGVVVRGQPLGPDKATERNFGAAAAALAKIEREFLAIQPQMPARCTGAPLGILLPSPVGVHVRRLVRRPQHLHSRASQGRLEPWREDRVTIDDEDPLGAENVHIAVSHVVDDQFADLAHDTGPARSPTR